MPKRHIIPDTARCKQCGRRFDLPVLRERKDYKPGICPMCGGYLVSIKESETVKGEQAGMLGVPGKAYTQKRPYKAGQMEFGSYAKYKEAMPSGRDLHWKTVAELKQMCSQRGLPTDGGKEDLIRRLK